MANRIPARSGDGIDLAFKRQRRCVTNRVAHAADEIDQTCAHIADHEHEGSINLELLGQLRNSAGSQDHRGCCRRFSTFLIHSDERLMDHLIDLKPIGVVGCT